MPFPIDKLRFHAGLLRDCLHKEARYSMVFGTFTGLASPLVEIVLAFALQIFLMRHLSSTASPPAWLPTFFVASPHGPLLLILLMGILRGFFQWLQPFLQSKLMEDFKLEIRKRVIRWAFESQRVEAHRFSSLFGEHLNNSSLVIKLYQQIAIQALTLLCLGIGLFFLAPAASAILLFALSLFALPTKVFASKVNKIGTLLVNKWESIQKSLFGSIRNILLLRIYGTTAEAQRVAIQKTTYYQKQFVRYYAIGIAISTAPQVFGIVLICSSIYFFEGYGLINAAILVSYFYLFIRFVQSASGFVNSLGDLSFFLPNLIILRKWLTTSEEDEWGKTSLDTSATTKLLGFPAGWRLKGISFSYGLGAPELFSGIDLDIPAGLTTVIVGESGSGKSTLLNLVLSQFKPQKGTIQVLSPSGEEFPLESIRESLLQSIGYLGPENFFVAGTVLDNLCYGLRHHPTDQDIEEALKLCECQFLNELPKRLGHELNEQGEGLSAGQKQRIGLARAILRSKSALILDEPTANLDSETEAKLVSTLESLKGKTTMVIVTHRPALRRLADKEIEVRHGRIES